MPASVTDVGESLLLAGSKTHVVDVGRVVEIASIAIGAGLAVLSEVAVVPSRKTEDDNTLGELGIAHGKLEKLGHTAD